VTITVRRLSKRSVTTPASSPSSVNGPNRQIDTSPTASPRDPGGASWMASQYNATFCIHVPQTDASCPAKKRR